MSALAALTAAGDLSSSVSAFCGPAFLAPLHQSRLRLGLWLERFYWAAAFPRRRSGQ
jgi:hypothetical protein